MVVQRASGTSEPSTVPYEVLSGVLASSLLPFVFGASMLRRDLKGTLRERLVGGAWDELERSPIEGAVWLHGASVGEVEGITPVARALAEKGLGTQLFVSTTSVAGRDAAAGKQLSAAPKLFPLDHPWFVAKALRRVQPKIVVLFETELWPNFLYALHRRSVPVIIVNGRISDRSIESYRRIRSLIRPAVRGIERIFAQTEIDKNRFLELGALADRVTINGCTKYDQPLLEEERDRCERFRSEIGLRDDVSVWVAGSVRPGEEEVIVEAFRRIREENIPLRLIVAPRHRDRFEPVAELLRKSAFRVRRRSDTEGGEWDILLLDTIGELRTAYGVASVASIGGTLVPIGGHNPLEPAPFAVPVFVGPHTANVRGALESLRAHNGVIEIQNGAELADGIKELLSDETKRSRAGAGALAAWREQLGSTDRVVSEIGSLLEARV